MFAMETWAMFGIVIVVFVLAPLHWRRLAANDLADLQQWFRERRESADDSLVCPKNNRVEEEMAQLRKKHFKLFSRCFLHVCFPLWFLLLYQAWTTPGIDSLTWAICGLVCYAFFTVITPHHLELTPRQLKFIALFSHMSTLMCIVSTAWSDPWVRFTKQGIHSATRFCLVLVHLDPKMTIPFQVLYTVVEVFLHVCVTEEDDFWRQVVAFTFVQIFILVITIASSMFIDMGLRGRIYAQLDTADAESLLSSFRRVLRGVCDGDVLLDSQMNVDQESQCLRHLILTDVSLKGKSFEHLLVDDEQLTRFRKFIEASNDIYQAPDTEDSAPPLCLRVSFRDSAGIRVAADIYHVPVPGLFGAQDPYHLIAFKEDPESRPQPEAADDAVPSVLLPQCHVEPRSLHAESRSMLSGSTGRSSQLRFCDELREMALLVDVDSELQDVTEVHVRFQRGEQPSSDLPSALRSTMPCLRKLVKPSEWEKVRSKARRFTERSFLDPTLQSRVLKQMTLQLPGHSGWLVAEATFTRFLNEGSLPGRKVWLHLEGFRPEKFQPKPLLTETCIQDTGLRSRARPATSQISQA
ncbi:Reverse transcriptase domain-containing protein [Durusdinium trenchii]|uniref:Reverse transcriptase domain-containing protein n=1 Tax=Durusdinium trenchii TaxID=1381693 RepID=A0ABP0N349_9DINO